MNLFKIKTGDTEQGSGSNSQSLFVNYEAGFTLVEMMMALAITLLVSSGVYEVFTAQQRAYNIQGQVAEMQQNARVAMDMMTRDIKMAGYDPRGTNFDPFESTNIDSDTIQFYADLDANKDDPPAGTNEDITFDFDSGESTITRTAGGTAQPIAENITALSFTYTFNDGGTGTPDNSDGDSTNDTGDIRIIRISLTARTAREDSKFFDGLDIDGDSSNGTARTRTLTAYVRPRNLGF